MICGKCFNGFLCESFPVPFVLSYRGFTRVVGTQVYIECSSGCNNSTEPAKSIITSGESLDVELSRFKYEINRKLSGEEL